jgi:hypothetical protein
VQYATSKIESESEHQMQGNEKSVVKARRIDRRKYDRVLAKICSPWIWKKTKTLRFGMQTTWESNAVLHAQQKCSEAQISFQSTNPNIGEKCRSVTFSFRNSESVLKTGGRPNDRNKMLLRPNILFGSRRQVVSGPRPTRCHRSFQEEPKFVPGHNIHEILFLVRTQHLQKLM